jgi:hypothetical protein
MASEYGRRSWFKKLAGVLLLLSPLAALAAPIPCPVSNVSSYPGSADGCYILNNIFNNFTYAQISGNAPPASNIGITPVSIAPASGFTFEASQWLNTPKTHTAEISYLVTVATGAEPLKMITMSLSGFDALGGTGTLSLLKDICLGGLWSGNVCSSGVTDQMAIDLPTGGVIVSKVFDVPQTQIHVRDTLALAMGTQNVTFQSFTQIFSDTVPVPEPACVVPVALALLLFARRAFRRT